MTPACQTEDSLRDSVVLATAPHNTDNSLAFGPIDQFLDRGSA